MSSRVRWLLMTSVAALAIAVGLATYATHLFAGLEGSTVNTRFAIRGPRRPPARLVVVKIDPRTFDVLDKQWPFPRGLDGEVIARIAAEHPAAVAFDVQLTERSQLGQKDDVALLGDLVGPSERKHKKRHRHRVAVFSFTETTPHGGVRFLGSGEGNKLLHEVGSWPANGLFPFDSGGYIRQMKSQIGGLPTFAVETAALAAHRPVSSWSGNRWIDFAGPAGTVPSVSFSDVVRRTLPPDFFRGKIVVIGATAPSLQDIHPTSTDSAMPGPEIQANAIGTVLAGFPLSSPPGVIDVALIVLLGLAVPAAGLRLRPALTLAVAVGLAAAFVAGLQIAFDDAGWIVSAVYPLLALAVAAVGTQAVLVVTEAVERVRVRDLFARFVPENVVDEVLASADGARLGGVQREGTAMFTDLRGFTSFAEPLAPDRVIAVLNRYLTEMSDAILDHGGTLVAYMGDGIFAVFGAPLAQADHADRALAAAREMLDVCLPRFNQWLAAEGFDVSFRMGIGLNSGPFMSGHVGSERRLEYAAIGDTTNTASRIEALTKGTPHQLLLSGKTRSALNVDVPELQFVEEKEIRGRTERIELWTVNTEQPVAPAAPTAQSGVPGASNPP
jgi:adenylate cyclase